MLTTDESLTLQGILRKMTTQDILKFVAENLLVKADDKAQDGDFDTERFYNKEATILYEAIGRLIAINAERKSNVS